MVGTKSPSSADPTYLRKVNVFLIYFRLYFNFVSLISSDNTRTITNLAIYVYKAFKIRNNENKEFIDLRKNYLFEKI